MGQAPFPIAEENWGQTRLIADLPHHNLTEYGH